MKIFILVSLLAINLFRAVTAVAAVANFDEINAEIGEYIAVSNGYQGIDIWNNFFLTRPQVWADNGYLHAMTSKENIALNGYGDDAFISNSSPFTLKSGVFTAAWNDDLNLSVIGYNGSTLLYNNTYVLNPLTPLLINFDYAEIDKVVFHTSGGIHHTGWDGSGSQFAVDDLNVTAIPEPSTYAAILGMTALGFVTIRRRKLRDRVA